MQYSDDDDKEDDGIGYDVPDVRCSSQVWRTSHRHRAGAA